MLKLSQLHAGLLCCMWDGVIWQVRIARWLEVSAGKLNGMVWMSLLQPVSAVSSSGRSYINTYLGYNKMYSAKDWCNRHLSKDLRRQIVAAWGLPKAMPLYRHLQMDRGSSIPSCSLEVLCCWWMFLASHQIAGLGRQRSQARSSRNDGDQSRGLTINSKDQIWSWTATTNIKKEKLEHISKSKQVTLTSFKSWTRRGDSGSHDTLKSHGHRADNGQDRERLHRCALVVYLNEGALVLLL